MMMVQTAAQMIFHNVDLGHDQWHKNLIRLQQGMDQFISSQANNHPSSTTCHNICKFYCCHSINHLLNHCCLLLAQLNFEKALSWPDLTLDVNSSSPLLPSNVFPSCLKSQMINHGSNPLPD